MDIIFKKNNKIYRKVNNIEESEKNIEFFDNLGLFDGEIVRTKIYDKKEELLEHELINPIIHSGEFTTSMAYDVTACALDLALKLVDYKLYSYDLLPHNYTYYKGKWLLYDFESFQHQPKNIKTQIRGMFKIIFSSFELLKLLERKDLKQYFLNRISHFYLLKMIDNKNWFLWCICQYYCLLLHKLGLYKKAYKYLESYFQKYEQKYIREIYSPAAIDKNLFEYVEEILEKNNTCSVFGLGESSANWAVFSNTDLNKFIYLDDYSICDKFYNYIYCNNIDTVSTAVIYPFMQDKEININYAYRGVYDYFAKERFASDAVVILNSNELYENNVFSVTDFIKNIVDFSNNLYIHSFNKITEYELAQTAKIEIEKYFNNVEYKELENDIVLVAQNKKSALKDYGEKEQYTNNNRGMYAKEQSLEIIKILKNKG